MYQVSVKGFVLSVWMCCTSNGVILHRKSFVAALIGPLDSIKRKWLMFFH